MTEGEYSYWDRYEWLMERAVIKRALIDFAGLSVEEMTESEHERIDKLLASLSPEAQQALENVIKPVWFGNIAPGRESK